MPESFRVGSLPASLAPYAPPVPPEVISPLFARQSLAQGQLSLTPKSTRPGWFLSLLILLSSGVGWRSQTSRPSLGDQASPYSPPLVQTPLAWCLVGVPCSILPSPSASRTVLILCLGLRSHS